MGMRVVLKRRTVRPYLNPQLDARVRYRRTLREAAALHDAKLAGVPAPTVYFVDPMGAEIIMEMIEGRRLKELLEEERRVDLMRVVGDYLGRLHGSGIVHGDPTTSNFVLSGEVLYALDFGLSFRSRSPRDQATDLHVLKEALESYHSDLFEESMKLLIEGYAGSFGGSREALAWLRRLESSGRYRGDRALERSLCLISGNRHKLQEMSVVAEAMGWRLRPCEGRKLEVQSDDLAEIALAAARAAAIPGSIVEDSGLFVRSLGGFPGPYSSYAMSTIGYRGLLKLMEGVEDRAARFESAIAYTDQAGRIRVFTARVCGAIAEEPAGTGGFGFDPVFIPAGYSRTFAEMDLREKSWISHRGIAMSRLLRWLEAYGGARGGPRGRRPPSGRRGPRRQRTNLIFGASDRRRRLARTHSHKRGKSHSTRPPALKSTSWITMSQKDIEGLIVKMAHEGLTPSLIGERLRDEYGIPSVKKLIGKSVVDVMREANVSPPIPEDLNNLLKKARRIMDHLATYRSDRKSRHALELVEAKIHRLSKYYKRKGILPSDWQYKAVVAQLA